ncbi:hypothetical protein [Pinisolibacter aquiterrae]|uniref:hypothetical protein n=1 Tax=Pinisolibacter aquiterrae TaxID=2815579 RepID=UPI001C3E8577|nr:hypothetical protein [Pinisolibacter aquiterrae]MBV5265203.1 hypothetical protein [Pinisolibacter aquiterrae]MCC8235467.1 hypothetical protein [Pinisolibacter aquiterrae]
MDAIRSLSVSVTVFLLLAGSTGLALAQSAGGSDGNDWLKQPAPSSGSGGAGGATGGSGASGGGSTSPSSGGAGSGWDPFKNAPAAAPSPAPSPSSSSGGTTSEGGYLTDKHGTSKVFNTRDAQGNITGGWIEHYDAQGKLIAKEPFSNTPPPTPAPTAGTTEGGYLTDKNGTSKVFNTRDAQGNITGGWIEHYDAQGKLISKEPFSNTPPPTPAPTAGTTEGGYVTGKNGTSKVFNTRDAQGNITGGWIEHYDPQGNLISKEPFSNTSAPTPPTNGPGDYEVGRVTDKNGTTKLIYTKDAQGNVVGGYTLQYDPQGKLIGKEPINGLGVMSPSTLPTQADLQGAWRGTFSGGGASGSMSITVSGAVVHGTISGSVKGDGVTGSFSGAIDAQGTFGANMSGTVHWNKGVAFSGHLDGRFTKGSASGTWTGAGGLDKASGTWRATP